MTENPADAASAAEPGRVSFPGTRFLYALLFAVIAWFVFWLVIAVAGLQFIVVLVNGRVNDELRRFAQSLAYYLWELLAYVAFVRDTRPFPMGPFPHSGRA